MYKISVNDHPFYLLKSHESECAPSADTDIRPYQGNPSELLEAVHELEGTDKLTPIGFYGADYRKLKSDFNSVCRIIKAMGGIVHNSKGEVLFIYRRGKWDLPKGKREKNESKKECAVREVEEETGLHNLEIRSRVGKTRHTYRHPRTGELVLKITYWYDMLTDEDESLILQEEEDIEDSKWLKVDDFLAGNYDTFANIKDILIIHLKKTAKRA